MSENEILVAPLTREKIKKMAIEFYGNSPDSKTIKDATVFGERVLREADALLEPWKKRKLCELRGHQFVLSGGGNHILLTEDEGVLREQVLMDWKTPVAACRNCDMKLVLVEGIKL